MAFKKGQSGNPNGRPKGGSIRSTELLKMMMDRGHEGVSKVIEMALNGDTTCLKIWMDKILPSAKKDTLNFNLPNLINKTPEELVKVLFESMSYQCMSVEEINCVLNMIKTFRSNEDGKDLKEFIDKSNKILEDLRAKNEREY